MVIIEPIRNQYLTALKERQHIIDKLNEIIRGLNALDFDDLTTIHTELVSIREALTTQNQTIIEINDNIEQIESELTSFDNRLIGLNADITDTEAHLTEFENDTILNLQAKVNKNGDTMTGNLGIPTTATGVRNNLAVNGGRLQNDLDNYEPMIRNTGTQRKSGTLELTNQLIRIGIGTNVKGPTDTYYLFPIVRAIDGNGNAVGEIYPTHDADGTNHNQLTCTGYTGENLEIKRAYLDLEVRYGDGKCRCSLVSPNGTRTTIVDWIA